MKAERRHDLETNDLAKKIIQAPDYFKLYGGRIALGIVVLAAVFMLVNYRVRASREARVASELGVGSAREAIEQLGRLNMMAIGRAPEAVAHQRQELIGSAQQSIDTANERSDDPKLLSQAALLRGDLYWQIANLNELPEAATRPALAIEPKPEDALSQAESAYRRVLDTYADQRQPTTAARFGLAAVAENHGKWDDARRQYEAVIADADLAEGFKAIARERLRALSQYEKGIYLALPVATTQAAAPATSAPASGPAR